MLPTEPPRYGSRWLTPRSAFAPSFSPLGIIPLIGCSIVCGGDVGKKHCLLIAHPQFPSAIIVAAPDFKTQDEWLKALRSATKIRGVMLCEEKKTYEEKLELEAKARKEEHERAAVSYRC
ncbi:unnamed protein product [Nippostrongylus brasiliensis]|uniref:PH domain-containing protein n=1 Tax=Nippostrongylus brasiliensis TaxID=27835 RepID=A0A0N4YTR3_NIPBR|nr:unnamed protein product [Nippostrongylus brasiliensis]